MALSTYRMQKEKAALLESITKENLILVYDLETTGLNVVTDRIAQLAVRACMVTEDGITELSQKTWYINPGFPMPERALAVHGISDEFLKDKPLEADIFSEISEYFADYPVCGYNNRGYDDKLMFELYKRCGAEFKPRASIDVYQVVSSVLNAAQVANHKLATVADYWGFTKQIEAFHNAEGDTLATELVLGKLLEIIRSNSQESSPYSNAPKVNVTSVSYWKGRENVRPRIYVDGKADDKIVKFWINPQTGEYYNADRNGPQASEYDVDDLEKQVLGRIKCDYKDFTGDH